MAQGHGGVEGAWVGMEVRLGVARGGRGAWGEEGMGRGGRGGVRAPEARRREPWGGSAAGPAAAPAAMPRSPARHPWPRPRAAPPTARTHAPTAGSWRGGRCSCTGHPPAPPCPGVSRHGNVRMGEEGAYVDVGEDVAVRQLNACHQHGRCKRPRRAWMRNWRAAEHTPLGLPVVPDV